MITDSDFQTKVRGFLQVHGNNEWGVEEVFVGPFYRLNGSTGELESVRRFTATAFVAAQGEVRKFIEGTGDSVGAALQHIADQLGSDWTG